MATPARQAPALAPFDIDREFAESRLFAGERLGPPTRRSGSRLRRQVVAIGLVAIGGGAWAMLGDTPTGSWPGWLSLETAPQPSLRTAQVPAVPEPTTTMAPTLDNAMVPTSEAEPPQLPPASEALARPALEAQPLVAPITTASLAPAEKSVAEPDTKPQPAAPGRPVPPESAAPLDPLQRRAAAVGLNPELSRVLLERLSSADYRNAGIAVRTALSETPDGGALEWPRQRKPGEALFKIRFVAGAAQGCRRYVATVTKDGWSTTAPPMETCGATARLARNR